MFRPPPRLCAALLWLALALLPLRGFAAAVMPVSMGAPPAAASAASAWMPCHDAALAGDQAATDGDSGAACSLCTLCHSLATQAVPVPMHLPTLPQAQPLAAADPAPAPGARDGPFRPPRALHA
jgi:hypothetical protein